MSEEGIPNPLPIIVENVPDGNAHCQSEFNPEPVQFQFLSKAPPTIVSSESESVPHLSCCVSVESHTLTPTVTPQLQLSHYQPAIPSSCVRPLSVTVAQQWLLYLTVALLSTASVIFLIVSISTSAIFSLSDSNTINRYGKTVTVVMTYGYWSECFSSTQSGSQNTRGMASVALSECLVYFNYTTAAQAFCILSIVFAGLSALLLVFLPVFLNQMRSRAKAIYLYRTACAFSIISMVTALIAVTVFIKVGSQNAPMNPTLEYGGILSIVSIIFLFVNAVITAQLANKNQCIRAVTESLEGAQGPLQL